MSTHCECTAQVSLYSDWLLFKIDVGMGGSYMCQLKVTLFLLRECPFFQEFSHFPLQGGSVCPQGWWGEGLFCGCLMRWGGWSRL